MESIWKRFNRGAKILKVSPEARLGDEDVDLFQQAGITSPEELDWIAQVKEASREEGRTSPYGLVRLHAMMQKDVRTLGPKMMSSQTERYLELFFQKVAQYFKHQYQDRPISEIESNLDVDRKRSSPEIYAYASKRLQIYREYQKATSPQEKAAVLTLILGLIHGGGNPEGLQIFGQGYPKRTFPKGVDESRFYEIVIEGSAQDFLWHLDQLGNPLKT